MGQSSSRVRETESSPSTSTQRRSPESTGDNEQEITRSPSTSSRRRKSTKRRSTVRKSIISLVKPATRSEEANASAGTNSAKRKSWLKSRRWSKAPSVVATQPEPEDSAIRETPTAPATATTSTATTSATTTIVPAIAPKEAEEAMTAPAAPVSIPIPEPPEDQPSHPTHEPEQRALVASVNDPPSISQNREEGANGATASIVDTHAETQIQPDSDPAQSSFVVPSSPQDHEVTLEDALNSPEISTVVENSPSQSQPTTGSGQNESERSDASPQPSQNPATPTPSPQNRQFPPPGTLVVVQGVVHTTDVPRPTTDSPSRPSPPLANPFSLPTDQPQHTQTSTRLSDSGLGSRIRRSGSNTSRRRSDVGSAARNRISALFGHGSRPASMSGGRPPSSAGNADEQASTEIATSTTTSHPSADTSSAIGSSSDSTPSLDVSSSSSSGSSGTESSSISHGREGNESDATTIPPTQEAVPGPGTNGEDHSPRGPDRNPQSQPQVPGGGGMISSSSIDVLGTLLSVAAAATAASLLTGSSDPILPPTVPAGNVNRPAPPTATSPGPGLGLGSDPFGIGGIGLGGGNAASGLGAGGRTERVRQAWGNIRDRLGLRPSNSATSSSRPASQSLPSSPIGSDFSSSSESGAGAGGGRDESTPLLSDVDGRRSETENARTTTDSTQPSRPTMEARDRMLAEMARAFQLGLGLNDPVPRSESGPTNPGQASRDRPDSSTFGLGRSRTGELPPEGTFERFLVDLQADLRVALGGGEQPQQQPQQPQEQEQQREQPRRDMEEPEDDEHEPSREDREDINELFRLIAEAEAEVRQRQRMIAQRQAALRALVSGASSALEDNVDTAASTDTASSSPSMEPPSPRPPSPRPPVIDRRARVESVPDSDGETDPSMPHLEGVSDDSDSEDEAPNSIARNNGPITSTDGTTSSSPATERTEASLARLSSMFAASSPPSSSGSRPVNSITDALNRRRALGVGRSPPTAPPASVSTSTSVPAPAPAPAPLPVVSLAQPPPVSVVPPAEPLSAPISGHGPAPIEHSPLPSLPASHSPSIAPASPTVGDHASINHTSPSASPPDTNAGRPHRVAIEEGTGRINWWRLYRFPPIAAPPPRGNTARGVPQTRGNDAAATPSTSLLNTTTTSPLQETPAVRPHSDMASAAVASPTVPSEGGDAPASSTSSTQPSTTTDNSTQTQTQTGPVNNTVVPVIVVGLQSVNLGFFGPGAGATNSPAVDATATPAAAAPSAGPPPSTASTTTTGDGGEEGAPSIGGDEAEDVGPDGENRPRRWPSRAAEALRNLRPGRRPMPRPGNGLLPPDMLDGPGSRTFLIYVIGGYYPPDHHIVTGDPDTLDSFEALLDIADLLGQVKPPTASKEDIERSGLEVIKATQVRQYEEEKKISSNCTERCLICLDDYHDEDDVRVLTCKHAFHMDCVDKWLQEGKNNCPACRGAGVSTGSS